MKTKSLQANPDMGYIRFVLSVVLFLSAYFAFGQPGKNGAVTITALNTVVNCYSPVTNNITAGSNTVTVNNSGGNNCNWECGDMVMVYQAQGASISTANSNSYGDITAYNSSGLYEFNYVSAYNGNTVTLQNPLVNSYAAAGRIQLIKVPSYTTLTVNAGASIVPLLWQDGGSFRRGGVVAIHCVGTVTVNGMIQATSFGFRPGATEQNTSGTGANFVSAYVSTSSNDGGEKGESIAGFGAEYAGGAYNRGAPANGGGGGNGHNAGGGGGANGLNGTPWNGQGIMCTACPGTAAWLLDPYVIANGNVLTSSSGGGRGGYSYGSSNQNALTTAPANTNWGGDYRDPNGGLGGRPLTITPQTRIFFGGGGGAGDSNNGSNLPGGSGGGIVYIIAPNIAGSGSIRSDGGAAVNQISAGTGSNNDAPAGGGGGGTIIVKGTVANSLTLSAVGGKGGDQGNIVNESEGPGGGGGGGYIAITAGTPTQVVTGGQSGITISTSLTEFVQNGATDGGTGQLGTIPNTFITYTVTDISATVNTPVCVGSALNFTSVVSTPGGTYQWSGPNGFTSTAANPVIAGAVVAHTGTYRVIYTTPGGCADTFFVAAVVNPNPVISLVPTNLTCANPCNGSVALNFTTLTAPSYTFAWNNGATTQNISSLCAGAYSVTVTDANGCIATANTAITSPTPLVVGFVKTNATCNNTCNGSITVNASGATPGYQYSLNGAANQASNSFTALCDGAYTVLVTDANGCSATINTTVTEPPVLNLVLVSTVPSSCGSNNGSLTVSASGGTPNYTYTVGAVTQASGTFSGLAPAVYNVTVTDLNGCTQVLSVTVGTTVSPTASILSQQPVSCFGGFNGSAIIGFSGGTPNYTFSLSPGPSNQASNVFNNLAAGSYTATVTDANGCIATVPLTIVQPAQLTYTTVITNASCNGVCDGQIQINATGGTAPYDYSHDNGLTFTPANPITNLCAGSVDIVVRDFKGCLVNSTVNITQPAPLAATFTTVNPVCNGSCDGSITVNASGGVPAYNYSLNGGATQVSNTLLNVCSGTQDVIITDANGCTLEVNPVLVDPPAVELDLVDMIESNCGFNNGELIVIASGPNPGFTYTANGGAPQTNGTFSNIFAGAYDIIAVDDLGCQAQEFFGVNDIEMSGVLIEQTDPLCFGAFDGTLEVTNVSGAAPISYELDNSGSSQFSGFFPNLGAGSHIVVISDAGNCIFTIPVNLGQPDPITFNTVITDVTCFGDSTGGIEFINTAGGTGAYMYSIDGGNNFVSGATFSGLPIGTYGLAVTDINGCMEFDSEDIIQPLPIEITNNKADLTCFQNASGFIQLGATGGNSGYQYSIDDGTTFTASSSFFSLTAQLYNVVVVDQEGCLQDTTITLTEPTPLVAGATSTDVLCNNACDGTITGTGNGGTVNYMFSVDGGIIYNVTGFFDNLCAGSYDLIVNDFNSCLDTADAIIGSPAGVTLSVTLTPSTCGDANGQIDMSLAGGTMPYNYSIDNGTTFTTTNVFTGLLADNYPLEAEDANGCSVDSIVTIVDLASPVISGVYVTEPTCYSICDASAHVSSAGGTGALSFEINGVSQTDSIFNGLCAGTYDVIITDVNACTDTLNIVIDQPDTLTFTTVATNLTCFQNQSGSIAVTVQGGTAPFDYSYDGGSTFGVVSNAQILSAGNYSIVVRDDNNCMATGTEVLTQPALLTSTLNLTDPTCFGFCNGSAVANASGGTLNYTYHWNGVTGASNTNPNLCSGTYTLEITDANNCSFDTTYTISDPIEFVIDSIGHTNASCNTFCDGNATIYAPGAVSYSFDNGGTFGPSNTLGSLCAQAYLVQATNAAGCIALGSVAIAEPLPVQLFSTMDSLMCTGDTIPLFAIAFGGTAPYTYTWSNGFVGQTQNVIQTSPATYTVSVTDQNGCTTAAPNSVDLTMLPVLAFTLTGDTSICSGTNIVLQVNVTDGAPAYSYQWSTSANDTLDQITVTPLVPTLYSVSVSDVCVTVDTNVQVSFYAVPTVQFVTSAQGGCSPLEITFSNDLAITNLENCTWTFSDGQTFNGCGSISATFINPDCYDVVFTGNTTDGCPVTGTFGSAVCVYDNPVANYTYSPQLPTELDNTVQFTSLSYGATTFDWTFGSSYGTSTAENPNHTFHGVDPDQTVNVCLLVTSEHGCVDSICRAIKFYGDFLVWVPNTFTPDGDEFNNQFKPVFSKDRMIEDYNLMIFNRWGELIFESHDPEIGWDGTYHAEFVKDGTYTWTIDVKDGLKNKSERFIGHVNKLQ
ncbi:MAG: gliding motility-related protein [Fluviicola sp.]|jgi:gliding motility-associated-like protein|uniref:T9SS type B sorting domain-containing protein n=1 Tax=Fluviicola sp. TaxID=1917219 RepID=UPI002622B469|nr:gliding motility-associated C-terminal domain-containing protein [Fluviicola sp.]MDF3026458.1 gliding motility-related protein [Fluviicola sp.]